MFLALQATSIGSPESMRQLSAEAILFSAVERYLIGAAPAPRPFFITEAVTNGALQTSQPLSQFDPELKPSKPDGDQSDMAYDPNPIATNSSARLAEPTGDARNCLAHLFERTRVGKADEPAAVDRIEIDSWGGRDVRLFQHTLGKFETVGREGRNIGIQVKRAIGGQKFVE